MHLVLGLLIRATSAVYRTLFQLRSFNILRRRYIYNIKWWLLTLNESRQYWLSYVDDVNYKVIDITRPYAVDCRFSQTSLNLTIYDYELKLVEDDLPNA